MKKLLKIFSIALSTCLFVLFSSSCWLWGGYNKIMYEYFSNPDNYKTMDVIVQEACFFARDEESYFWGALFENSSTKYSYRDYKEVDVISVYIIVRYANRESWAIEDWWDETDNWQECLMEYEITSDTELFNNLKQDSFDILKPNSEITIRACNWVYGDADWRWILMLEKDGVYYSDFETELKALIKRMDENRSLF
ncbi:MAG: hypothetical protein E7343_03855 [Clostridiales bacterium]|nr:hypothetical protein [Clostridiales bacterium]